MEDIFSEILQRENEKVRKWKEKKIVATNEHADNCDHDDDDHVDGDGDSGKPKPNRLCTYVCCCCRCRSLPIVIRPQRRTSSLSSSFLRHDATHIATKSKEKTNFAMLLLLPAPEKTRYMDTHTFYILRTYRCQDFFGVGVEMAKYILGKWGNKLGDIYGHAE